MKELPMGNRIMDRAYLMDGDITHTGEALLLACLVASKGTTKRGKQELKDVSQMMKDPNLPKKKPVRRKAK
jgi:hypothetical protein